ncbi:MAG: hypothetical protein HQL22_10690 [Candidatus Omnitrophica bacterium]|nr:hypothetical protein [Candidatus Omnitrophota bacterium]
MIKKIVIILFCGLPLLMMLVINAAAPLISNAQIRAQEDMSLPGIKHELFMKRPVVDTVICADSRISRLSMDVFLKRGWHPFSWTLSGLNPADEALQLAHALYYGKIRRAIIGVSFEAMAEKSPAMTSQNIRFFPFNQPQVGPLWGLTKELNSNRGLSDRLRLAKVSLDLFFVETKVRLQARLTYCYKRLLGKDFLTEWDAYGNVEFSEIRRQIKDGVYDFQKNRDPLLYFNLKAGEKTFLKNKALSLEAQKIYAKMFEQLRLRKIPTVVVETVKTAEYQRLIDADPLLKRLNDQWRDFFRQEAYGGIRFLEGKEAAACYDPREFIDAVHFVGERTEKALAEKLALEIEKLESSSVK